MKKRTKEQIIDSLWQLQNAADSLNIDELKKIIARSGWPGANQLGDHYCMRPAPDVTILMIHLGASKRAFQIATLKNVIQLCGKNEESWGNAQTLMNSLHLRFSKDFSEFSFLETKGDHLLANESFFSLSVMSDILMSHSNEKIQVKCKSKELFSELKAALMLAEMSPKPNAAQLKIYKAMNKPLPQAIAEDSFEFIPSPELGEGVILYKFSKK